MKFKSMFESRSVEDLIDVMHDGGATILDDDKKFTKSDIEDWAEVGEENASTDAMFYGMSVSEFEKYNKEVYKKAKEIAKILNER